MQRLWGEIWDRNSPMIVLIDADIVCYRNAAVSEDQPEAVALRLTDQMMQDIINNSEADQYKSFLTGSLTKYPKVTTPNFRNQINPEYKMNRKQAVPRHLNVCRQFLIEEWNTVVTEGYEADDALGVEQDKTGVDGIYDTCIASIDKDLLQIPGYHYNFVTGKMQQVSELDGIKWFYKQMLIGDSSDNVKGVDKIGSVKASKIIDPLEKEIDMYQTVCSLYKDVERFDINSDCLWIWRNMNESFTKRYVWNGLTDEKRVS